MDSKKLLVIGAFNIPYVDENWREPITHLYGENALCINANQMLCNYGLNKTQKIIFRLLRKHEFAYCLFYHDWIFGDFKDIFFNKLRSHGVPIAAFYPDDEPDTWFNRNRAYDHHYDLIASHSSYGARKRRESNLHDVTHYIPWGYNPRKLYPINTDRDVIDVVFIGKNKKLDGMKQLYREDGRNRDRMLFVIAETCEKNSWSFRIFGHGWNEHPTLKQYWGGVLSQREMVEQYSASKIVFNPGWSNDDGDDRAQTKLRHFEVPGCGAFQLTNRNNEIEELFVEDENIVYFDSDSDLVDKISFYLNHNNERKNIAKNSYQHVKANHTIDQRIKKITSLFESKYDIRAIQSSTVLDIQTITYNCNDSIQDLIGKAAPYINSVFENQYIQFVNTKFSLEFLNKGYLLQPFITKNPDLFICGSMLEFNGAAKNSIQPTREELHTTYIPPNLRLKKSRLSKPWKKALANTWIQLESDKVNTILDNLIIKGASLTKVLTSIHSEHCPCKSVQIDEVVSEFVLRNEMLDLKAMIAFLEPKYIQRLKKLLDVSRRNQKQIAVYGVCGDMAERTLQAINANLIGMLNEPIYVDNRLAGKEIYNSIIVSGKTLLEKPTDYVVIAAAISGKSIMKSLEPISFKTKILPLYDLDHPNWKTINTSEHLV